MLLGQAKTVFKEKEVQKLTKDGNYIVDCTTRLVFSDDASLTTPRLVLYQAWSVSRWPSILFRAAVDLMQDAASATALIRKAREKQAADLTCCVVM